MQGNTFRVDWRRRDVVVIPGDPVGKQRPKFNRKTGAVYTPTKTAQFERFIKWQARHKDTDAPIKLEILAVFKRPKRLQRKKDPDGLMFLPSCRIDVDNIIKATCDGLQGMAFNDDRQVVDVYARALYSEKNAKQGRTEIAIFDYVSHTNNNHEKNNDLAPSPEGTDPRRGG